MRSLSVIFALAALLVALVTAWTVWPPLTGVVASYVLIRLALITNDAANPQEEAE